MHFLASQISDTPYFEYNFTVTVDSEVHHMYLNSVRITIQKQRVKRYTDDPTG